MRILWVDTETTGLDYEKNGIFEFACIFTEKEPGKATVYCERDFFFNPLSEGLEYSEEAAKINGVTREEMEKFPPEKEAIEKIIAFLTEVRDQFGTAGKMIFCGYNTTFDWEMTQSLFRRHGYEMEAFFDGTADVFQQVKNGGKQKVVPYLKNLKLTTLCEHYKIDLKNAHTALADIRATRELARVLQKSGVNLF